MNQETGMPLETVNDGTRHEAGRPASRWFRRRDAPKVAFFVATLAALISAVPNWYGAAVAPAGALYMGSTEPFDNNGYFAKMRAGYRGDWLTVNLYSSEDHPPVFLFPFHVALGHAAGLFRDYLKWRTGEDPPVYRTMPLVYETARFALTAALFLIVFWLAGAVTNRPSRRLWMVALAAFAGGCMRGPLNTEAHTLFTCIRFPNFIVSLLFYCLACGSLLYAMRRPERRWRWALYAALAGFGLGWVHPFDVPPLSAIAAVAFVWRWVQTRRFPGTLFTTALCFGLFAGAPILYQMSLEWRIPLFAQMDAQNVLYWGEREEWAKMLEAYLACGLLGIVCLWRRRRRPEAMFVMVWVVVGVAMLDLPVRFQRRMIEGLPIGLAFATAAAVEGIIFRPLARWRAQNARAHGPRSVARGRKKRLRLLRHGAYVAVFTLLLPKTLFVLYDNSVGLFGRKLDLFYTPAPEVAALEWLSRNSDWRDVVWAEDIRGNSIPYLSGNRVFSGLPTETIDHDRKLFRSLDLFSMRMPLEAFRRIAREYNVTYIYVGSREVRLNKSGRDFGEYDPQTLGQPVYDSGAVRIYKARRGGIGSAF